MTTEITVLKPDYEFKYPFHYNVTTDASLRAGEERALSYAEEQNVPYENARGLLLRWARSARGAWQAEQTARYPSFHLTLPDMLVPRHMEANVFRRQVLRGIARAGLYLDSRDPWQQQPTDLHPIGHMARVLSVHDDLVFGGEMQGFQKHPHLIPVTRMVAAVHDIGETQHPTIVEEFGFDVGDIAADIGKTTAQRQQERQIFTGMLHDTYDDTLDSDTQEAMVRIVAHDVVDKELGEAHAFVELAHHVNAARNGMVIAESAVHMTEWHPDDTSVANVMSLMAEQIAHPLQIKFESIYEHAPHLRISPAAFIIETTMAQLWRDVHCRDDDEEWLSWRDDVSDIYGSYTPSTH